MKKSLDTVESLSSLGGNLVAAECNLASLASIQKFAKELPSLIADKKIDVLCLNAGLSRNTAATDCARTEDGFELTGKQAISWHAGLHSDNDN
jgi:NAD(P)-dependent dehydrogenase (short-subunit alcohol dehydrogenase family)